MNFVGSGSFEKKKRFAKYKRLVYLGFRCPCELAIFKKEKKTNY